MSYANVPTTIGVLSGVACPTTPLTTINTIFGQTYNSEDFNLRQMFKAFLIILEEEQIIQMIAICPDIIDLIDNPTDAMREVVKARDL